METALFDYELPEERIAQHALPERDAARLLVLEESGVRHAAVKDFASLLPEGALLVLNDTRVFRARILGERRETGGRVEIFLLRRAGAARGEEETWTALGRANRALRPGTLVDAGELSIEILDRGEEELVVRLRAPDSVDAALEKVGHVPLPPYVRRADTAVDAARYQTVFARESGSVAAPTAGLHLSPALLDAVRARGVEVAFVTLHVGLGTFRPVSVPDLDRHPMHAEEIEVRDDVARSVRRARARGGKVVAVGTTVVRALESARDPGDPRCVVPYRGETRLLIQPGYEFGPVDALFTNFHMPKSTLLALVCAFAGRDRVLRAYGAALAAGYRFLSYGDAMWIPERLA